MDVIQLLKKDHQEVTKLFQRFHGSRNGRARRPVVERICQELELHAQVEEEIFYPALQETGDPELMELVDESLREHQKVKEQVRALRPGQGSEAGDDGGDADGRLDEAISTLERDVEHHVTEEEGQVFPRVESAIEARARTAMGQRIQRRKRELTGEAGGGRWASGGARSASTGRARTGRAAARRGKTSARRGKARQQTAKTRRTKGRARKQGRAGRRR